MSTELLCPEHGGTSVKSKCKQCRKEQQRRRYWENRDEILEKKRRYHQENRDKRLEYNRRYRKENRDYTIARDSKRAAAKNRASQYFATNSGKPWTPQEVAKMHRLHRQGLSNYEVAVELGRSYSAVIGKLAKENARH